MQCFSKFKQYNYYMWVYIIGTVVTFLNCLFIQSSYVLIFSLVVLYCILFYKGIEILRLYKKSGQKDYQPIEKRQFKETYGNFRVKVLLFILAFIVICFIAKYVFKIKYQYFYSCTFFFLWLDRMFINVGCLLRIFSDPKSKAVVCCCSCPCRGWDLIMIHIPLLFALSTQAMIENIMIGASTAVAIITCFGWEKYKYSLVEVRSKCPTHCNLYLCREHLN